MTEEVKFILSADDSRATAALARTDAGLKKVAQSTALTKQQMQQLNFQLTDIVVGLSTGQSPFYVLLQQGGQLKDMFGGVGGAARALATGIAGLINPYTLAAAAIGAVATAAVAGWRESTTLRDALALTGNYAQLTGDSFASLAERVSEAAGTSQGAARDITQGFVSTGQFSGAALESIATAAGRVAEVSGQSAEEVVKDFAGMARGVAQWAAEHNRSWHFVSAAQLEYIEQLEEQGNKEAAMVEVGRAVTQHLEGQRRDLTLTEQRWKILGEVADAAWQKMKGLAGGVNGDGSLKAVQDRLDEWARASLVYRGTPAAQAEIAGLLSTRGTLNSDALRAANRGADAAAVRNEEDAAIERRKQLKTVTDALSGANSEYSRTLRTIQQSLKGGDITQEQANQLLTQAAVKYGPQAEKGKSAKQLAEEREREYREMVRNTLANRGPRLADIEAAGYGDASKAAELNAAQTLREQARLEEQLSKQRADYLEQVSDQAAQAGVDLFQDDRARGLAQIALDRSLNERRLDELKVYGDEREAFMRKFDAIDVAREQQLTESLKPEYQIRIEAWADTMRQMRREAEEFNQSFVDGGRDAFTEFLRTGKISMQSFTDLITQTIAKLIYDKLLAKQMANFGEAIFNALTSAIFGVPAGGSSSGAPSSSGTGSDPYAGFANGGDFSGGLRIVGERGPELEATGPSRIWNAQQTRDMLSGGRGGGITIHQTLNVGQGVSAGQVMQAMTIAKDRAVAEIQRQKVRGNRVWD